MVQSCDVKIHRLRRLQKHLRRPEDRPGADRRTDAGGPPPPGKNPRQPILGHPPEGQAPLRGAGTKNSQRPQRQAVFPEMVGPSNGETAGIRLSGGPRRGSSSHGRQRLAVEGVLHALERLGTVCVLPVARPRRRGAHPAGPGLFRPAGVHRLPRPNRSRFPPGGVQGASGHDRRLGRRPHSVPPAPTRQRFSVVPGHQQLRRIKRRRGGRHRQFQIGGRGADAREARFRFGRRFLPPGASVRRIDHLAQLPGALRALFQGPVAPPDGRAVERFFQEVWNATWPGELYQPTDEAAARFADSLVHAVAADRGPAAGGGA